MGQIKFISSITMITLFTIAILVFAINFGVDNNAGVMLANDSDYITIRDDIISNTSQFRDDLNSSSEAFTKSSLSATDETTTTGGQFKIGLGTMSDIIGSTLVGSYKKIFGEGDGFGIFFTTLIAIITYIGILYSYKAWIGRDPD